PETNPSNPIWMGRRGWVVEVVKTPPVLSAHRCFVCNVLFVLLTVDIKCTEANLFQWEELRSDEVVATS
ncbi:hypothetical protein BYT27DRAFT_7186419, partial [Phlegmacium glaucopus]